MTTVSQVTPPNWAQIVQACAAIFAAIGTISAVFVSLVLAWRNRTQFKMTTRLNVLPMLIKEREQEVRRLERRALLFKRSGPDQFWEPTADVSQLKTSLAELTQMSIDDEIELPWVVEDDAFHRTTQPEKATSRKAKRALVITALENLIVLREEFTALAMKTKE